MVASSGSDPKGQPDPSAKEAGSTPTANRRGAKSARSSSASPKKRAGQSIMSHRPALPRQPTAVSHQQLTSAGFTAAQADGVIVGRSITTSARTGRRVEDTGYMNQLRELKEAGFSPMQLCEAGFPAKVLRSAGFGLEELMSSGATLDFLVQAGFQALELTQAGYAVQQLKDIGFDAGKLRREAHVSFPALREAGFTPVQFRQCGFGPAELKEAGFGLKDLKEAGFSAAQLGRKAGFTLTQLRKAGYTAGEVLAIGADISADDLHEAGFSNPQIKAAVTGRKLPKANATEERKGFLGLNLGNKSARQKKKKPVRQADDLPKHGLEGLLIKPPAPEVLGPSKQIYSSTSFCMKPGREPRRTAIFFVESPFFDPLVLLVIICNCVTMAWESPLDPPGTWKAAFIDKCESVYLAVYTVEMFSKILAYGLVWHRHSYLRDPWCQLDFVVVTLAWIPILTDLPLANYSVIRSVRALRPLRALKRMPGMPLLVQSILNVLPKMGAVSMLCAFTFFVFGIVGMELYQGALHYRCDAAPGTATGYLPDEAQAPLGAVDTEAFCNPRLADQCEDGARCAYFATNPGNGIMSFDSTPLAFVILLQIVTFDDWATSMYALMASFSDWVVLYYLLVCVVGGFFVINLFLAVIFEEYVSLSRIERAAEDMEARTAPSTAPLPDSGSMECSAPDAESSVAGATDDEGSEVYDEERLSGVEEGSPTVGGPQTARSREYMLMAAAYSPGTVEVKIKERTMSWRGPNWLTRLANSDLLNNFTLGLVIFNMLVMCLPYQGMTDQYAQNLELLTSVITAIFIAEMLIKHLGLGFHGYWSDSWNALDGTIVLMSIAEIMVTDVLAYYSDGSVPKMSFLRVLRMLRVLRVLRLMKNWQGLHKILTTFLTAVPQMGSLFVLTFLIMTIFALLGMQMLGGQYSPANGFSAEPCPGGVCPDPDLEELPHYHFDYFGPALSTVFVLFTGEWIDATLPAASVMGATSLGYFLPTMLIGRFLIMNLFVGILLNAFAEEDEEEPEAPAPAAAPAPVPVPTLPVSVSESGEAPDLAPVRLKGRSLCLFGPDNHLRQLCQYLHTAPLFDPIVMVVIMFSSVCLALDSPRNDPNSPLAQILHALDFVWTCLFILEMAIKVVAKGFIFGEGAYLKDAWNQLDFTIVLASVVVLAAEAIPQLRPLRTLRVLRVLRPLRMVSRNAGMKLIVTSLIKALPDVSNVFYVVFAVQAVFAILGMQLFMGTFASCTDPSILSQGECHEGGATAGSSRELQARALRGGGSDNEFDGTEATIWKNPRFGSFDNFGEAMRLLYIMASGDEWEAPMYSMMAATTPGHAPVRDDFSPAAFYGIAWMFIGSFFALNLFVGVIVDSFDRIKKETDSSATMTAEQQQWVKAMQSMAQQKPAKGNRAPPDPVRRLVFDAVTSPSFDGLITGVIVANIGLMACNYWGLSENVERQQTFDALMHVFTTIYYGECALKLFAIGISGYFREAWNRFDFFLVCVAAVDDILEGKLDTIVPLPPFLLRVLRVFRILRILRLLKSAKGLRDLIVTTVLSFPSLINVGSLLTLVVFVYSVLGLNLFAFLVHQENIDDVRNFDTLSGSAMVLFQVLTGDAWSALMAEAMVTEETGLCSAAAGDCGMPMVAMVYFVSFQVLGTFVFLNLVVAVILENFSSLGSLNPDLVSAADVEAFKEAWADFDPDADNYIPSKDLPTLVLRLPPPMGLKGVATENQAKRFCMALTLKQYDGKVAFQEVVHALTRKSFVESEAVDTGSIDSLEVPEQPTPPPLPVGEIAAPSNGNDKFALEMPSARRVFALQVIEKHAQRLIERQEEKQKLLSSALPRSTDAMSPSLSRFMPRQSGAPRSSTPLSKRAAAALGSGVRSVRGRLTFGGASAQSHHF